MSKNGFRLVVTMHPQISMFIHHILSMHVDYTFKRVDGNMDEWEVAGMSDRFKQRLSQKNTNSSPSLTHTILFRNHICEFVL